MNPRDEKEKQIVISIIITCNAPIKTELVFKNHTTRFILSLMSNANAILLYHFLFAFSSMQMIDSQKLPKGNSGQINN